MSGTYLNITLVTPLKRRLTPITLSRRKLGLASVSDHVHDAAGSDMGDKVENLALADTLMTCLPIL